MAQDSSSELEVTIRFNDGQVITISDKQTAKHAAVLVRAISSENADWETERMILSYPLDVPFPCSAGRFIFDHIRQYRSEEGMGRPPRLGDYQDAERLSLEELKHIIELANFLECLDFVKCIAFVIAQKLQSLSVEDIVKYMGVDSSEKVTDEGLGWPNIPIGPEDRLPARML